MMRIKQENQQPISRSPEDLKIKIGDAIKESRVGSNHQNNCGHATHFIINVIKHYYGLISEKPILCLNESSRDSSTTTVLKYDKQGNVNEAIALRSERGLNSELPPTMDRHPDLDVDLYNLTTDDLSKFKVTNTLLNQTLKRNASDQEKMLFGHIGFAAKNQNEPGHVCAFVATDTEVFYIDPQFYNGLTQEGEPLFDDVCKKYNFNDKKRGLIKFQTDCFYVIHGGIQNSIALNNTSETTPVEPMSEQINITTESPDARVSSSTKASEALVSPQATQPLKYYRTTIGLNMRQNYDTIELFQAAVKELVRNRAPHLEIICSSDLTREDTIAVASSLQWGMTFNCDRNMSIDNIKAASAALKPFVVFNDNAQQNLKQRKAAASSLADNVYYALNTVETAKDASAIASALKAGTEIMISPVGSPIHSMQAAASALQAGVIVQCHDGMSTEQLKAISEALKPLVHLLCGIQDSVEKMKTVASGLNHGAVFSCDSFMKPEHIKTVIPLLKPDVRFTFQKDVTKQQIEAAVNASPPRIKFYCHNGLSLNDIRMVASTLKTGMVLDCDAALSNEKINAAVSALKSGVAVFCHTDLLNKNPLRTWVNNCTSGVALLFERNVSVVDFAHYKNSLSTGSNLKILIEEEPGTHAEYDVQLMNQPNRKRPFNEISSNEQNAPTRQSRPSMFPNTSAIPSRHDAQPTAQIYSQN